MDSIWSKPPRLFRDLREFLAHLASRGELKTVDAPVSPVLELTEISRRVLARRGPALLFTQASPVSTLAPAADMPDTYRRIQRRDHVLQVKCR